MNISDQATEFDMSFWVKNPRSGYHQQKIFGISSTG